MVSPEISVIICTYNRDKYLFRALECLKNQDISSEKYEIILINNLSTDSTEEICKDFISLNPGLTVSYFIENQQGLSFARNRGILESKAEILVFLDDDAYAAMNYLSSISGFFNHWPEVPAAGGKIIPEYEIADPAWMNPFLASLVSAQDLGNRVRKFKSGKYPIGANMIIRKSMFQKYGNFNTDLGRKGSELLGGEEKDFFYRLIRDKKDIYYIPDAIVSHYIPDVRVQIPFIKKLGIGIGKSQILQLRKRGSIITIVGLIKEGFKWVASIILMIYFCFILQYEKGIMILKFRSYVTKGLFSGLKKNY